MKLSIIIVNYKVKIFLEQSLISIFKSIAGIESEIFVVDNNSCDDSVEYLRGKFPKVNFIENHENLGFAKANNQAIRQSKGDYVLLLNPDTLLSETTLSDVITFMDNNKNAGAAGVKMVDATGRYLPESKRSIPTPWVSFCKVFGLSGLFPKSKIFNRYSLGYLDKDEIHKIDILAGAFMIFRKDVLDQIGLLDEDFFMYGEDIDISYRVVKGGYDNYYLPYSILHYKGESTPKHSIKYVKIFYEAMDIFFKKHNSHLSFTYSLAVRLTIVFRGFMSAIHRLSNKMFNKLDSEKNENCNLLVISKKDNKDNIDSSLYNTDITSCEYSITDSKIEFNSIESLINNKNITDIIFDDSIYTNEDMIVLFEKLGDRGLTFSIYNNISGRVVSPALKFHHENA